jgi:polysaccharide pyruvyl transferase WcaK-like protein
MGILTYHRSHNFGALLQAYALKTYIASLGYEVEFIDYWPQYHEDKYALWSWNKFLHLSIKSKVKMFISFLLTLYRKFKRRKLFLDFIDTYIIPKRFDPTEYYDLVIYGSDQIWRYQQHPSYKGYNQVYFGDDTIHAKHRISFSASIGNILSDEATQSFFREHLKNFDALSVRESAVKDFIQPLTSLEVYHTLDPVFLLSKEQWDTLAAPRQLTDDYILLYNLLADKNAGVIAKRLSKINKVPVILIKGNVSPIKRQNERCVIGPMEFLSLVKYATVIVTSSFHGVVFSLVFQKNFYVSMNRNTKRVLSLLETTGLSGRFITDISKFTSDAPINYDYVNKQLDEYKSNSKNYLEPWLRHAE